MSPLRNCSPMSLTWPGPCGMKTVVFFEELPRSLMVSKYWVTMMRSITSLAEVPSTLWEKFKMFSLNPSVIACLCLATPRPPKYLDSASASARLIWRIFSASPLYTLASWSLWAVKYERNFSSTWKLYQLSLKLSLLFSVTHGDQGELLWTVSFDIISTQMHAYTNLQCASVCKYQLFSLKNIWGNQH